MNSFLRYFTDSFIDLIGLVLVEFWALLPFEAKGKLDLPMPDRWLLRAIVQQKASKKER
jgi:hypothetical protein